MKIDLTQEIVGLDGKKIQGQPLIAAEQLAALVLADRGESVKTALEAYKLNALMEKIALAKGEINLEDDQIELLKKVLEGALKSKNVSTFLVGRLFGILEGENLVK